MGLRVDIWQSIWIKLCNYLERGRVWRIGICAAAALIGIKYHVTFQSSVESLNRSWGHGAQHLFSLVVGGRISRLPWSVILLHLSFRRAEVNNSVTAIPLIKLACVPRLLFWRCQLATVHDFVPLQFTVSTMVALIRLRWPLALWLLCVLLHWPIVVLAGCFRVLWLGEASGQFGDLFLYGGNQSEHLCCFLSCLVSFVSSVSKSSLSLESYFFFALMIRGIISCANNAAPIKGLPLPNLSQSPAA